MKTTNSPCRNQQKGAVLLIALVMLLLMTILGISSMRSTTLQERMAGNMRDQGLAFQAAETALRQGELAIPAIANVHTVSTDSQSLSSFDGVATQPKFKLTPIPGVTIVYPGESTEAGAPVNMALVRVEAEGYGAATNADDSPSAKVVLRSIYIKR